MRRLIWLLLATATLPSMAQAEMVFSCQRYRSKCAGDECLTIANKLKLDTGRSMLTLVTPQTITYRINDNKAQEVIEINGEEQRYPYEKTESSESLITLSNLQPNGTLKEQVTINLINGIYTHYAIHNDGSIKDVPVGLPYRAWFGWCDRQNTVPAPQGVTP
ncbi:MAG: hypothetical protein SFT92_09850 [Rickettsiales bacterium]|nr:hypothetical protein [Rickettsiales bacterium]